MAIIRLVIIFACLGLFLGEINAFAPKAFALTPLVKTSTLSSPAFQTQQQQHHALPSDFLLDEMPIFSSSSLSVASLGGVLQSASVLVGGLLVLLIGLFVYFQSFITSNAATQLETQARTDYPDLWSEYQTQLNLEGGETLKSRPDIVLSLRNKIQAREFKALQNKSNASLEDYEQTD
jgi:hypothetical protein